MGHRATGIPSLQGAELAPHTSRFNLDKKLPQKAKENQNQKAPSPVGRALGIPTHLSSECPSQDAIKHEHGQV